MCILDDQCRPHTKNGFKTRLSAGPGRKLTVIPWERHCEAASLMKLTLEADAPAMQFDQSLDESETEAGTLIFSSECGLELDEWLEELWLIFRRDPDAVVPDRKGDPAS